MSGRHEIKLSSVRRPPQNNPRSHPQKPAANSLPHLQVQMLAIGQIRPNPRNARMHSRGQIREIANIIEAVGWTVPILVDEKRRLIAGHGRLEAAKLLGLQTVPAIMLRGLSEAKRRALALADNRIPQSAGWDRQVLAAELPQLAELLIEEGLDISLTGFEPAEIDQLQVDFEENTSDPNGEIDPAWQTGPLVSERGSLWILGGHRLLCGDARSERDLAQLMGGAQAAMAFLDPPYNLRIRSVVGRGRTRHAEFPMASGEMSAADYSTFLQQALASAAAVSRDGALHFVCGDWRHIPELLTAGRQVYGETINLAVWVKSTPGQGSLYRSQHELIGVFRVGKGQHLNNIELGRHGRSRSNVWHYSGLNQFRAGRMDELRAHPTVKPVGLVADAIKDCTRRGDIVLDTFCGSGTTILAAERVGRRACAVELEPRFVDVAIRRWQSFTRRDAVHAESGRTFDEMAAERLARNIRPAATHRSKR
jgi:DNA modification methylase